VWGSTREECAAKLRDLRTERGLLSQGAGNTTVEEYLKWWLTIPKPKAKNENSRYNHSTALNHVITELGPRKLVDLEIQDVSWLLQKMADDSYAKNTVMRVKSVLGQALEEAIRQGQVTRNVARLAILPELPDPQEKESATMEEAAKLLMATEDNPLLRAYILVGFKLGLRPSELLGLAWSNVDLTDVNASIRVDQALIRDSRTYVHTLTKNLKTKKSRRPLALPPEAAEALKALTLHQKAMQLKATRWNNEHNLVFTTGEGAWIEHGDMRNRLNRLYKRAGTRAFSMNELSRHTMASLYRAAGMPKEHLADLLGHRDTRMVEKHYIHDFGQPMTHHLAYQQSLANA
jgi:integrase